MSLWDSLKEMLGLGGEDEGVENEDEVDWDNLDERVAYVEQQHAEGLRRRREQQANHEELGYGSDGGAVADGEEGEWREGSRRRALRDERLLADEPDEESSGYSPWHYVPWEPVLLRQEADRLFSETMRTGDEDLRTVDTDPEQLDRLGLPRWRSEREVAEALDLTVDRLFYFASHRQADRHFHYVRFTIPKNSGGRRTIMAPKRELKAIQRDLLAQMASELPVAEPAHGFREGRSIKTNAEPHVGREVVVKMDLADFFETVTFPRVRGLFVSYGYGYPVATTLAVLCTEAERQPVETDDGKRWVPTTDRYCVQGAPTSPAICNSIARRLDHRLAGLADSLGFTYTRYADDMTFSSDDDGRIGTLLRAVADIADDEGFVINEAKTRVMRRGQRQSVTGVVVNDELGLSRQVRRRWRAMIHQMKQERSRGELEPERVDKLEGKLAYLEMLNPDQAGPLRAQWEGE